MSFGGDQLKVGVLGGTFDPVHWGHLVVAEEARTRLDLDRVIFMTAGQPWLREGGPVADGEDRLKMVELAVQSNPAFEAGAHEVRRSGPTYTVDTLQELRQELGDAAELNFIIGMDALENFHRWRDPELLVSLCRLAVVNRPGHQGVDVNQVVGRYPAAGPGLTLVNVPRMEISSSEVRQRIGLGISVRYLVPEAVEEYIRHRGLYRASR